MKHRPSLPFRSCLRRLLPALALVVLLAPQAQAADEGLAFAVIGDWGMGTEDQRAVAAALGERAASLRPSFIISVGDHFYPRGVSSPEDPQWRERFEQIYSVDALQVPWRVVLGNHDHRGNVEAQLRYGERSPRWHLPTPYYKHSEALGPRTRVDFFFLDTTPLRHAEKLPLRWWPFDNEQYGWLERELAASRATWKIVIGHHPVFSGGSHGNTAVLVERLKPLLERHGVQAYINGHNHSLEHVVVNEVNYLTVGSGGEARRVRSIEGTRAALGDTGFMLAVLKADALRLQFVDQAGATVYATEIPRRL